MSVIFKRTKILATVGPAINDPEKINSIMLAGANGFRLNFSHGDYEERRQQVKWIREASQRQSKPVAILQDLQGPKIRLGNLKDDQSIEVKTNDELILDYAAEHDGGLTLPVQYNLADRVKPGEPIYIFDGKIRTVVKEIVSETAIKVEVKNNGTIMSRKGINLPDTDFGGDILTEKDIKDLEFGAKEDFDYVALSFVQTADDIESLRQRMAALGSTAHIIAKIETKSAIVPENLEEIIKASDGVMVARGDLAVEAGAEVVPIIQHKIITLCRKYGKLVIVATQMMMSMVDNPEPTRAEVSDVANAVIDGTDTVMLSDETANGNYPLETVEAMKKVIVYTQVNGPVSTASKNDMPPRNVAAISFSAVKLSEAVNATAIIAETNTGATSISIAAFRPDVSIISVTSNKKTAQKLALSYANRSYVRPEGEASGLVLAQELKSEGYFDGDEITVVIVSGHVPGATGGTDTIRIKTLK